MSNKNFIASARTAEAPPRGGRPLREGIVLPVKRYIFIDKKNQPYSKIYVALHKAENLPKMVPDYQKPHKHNTDEFYFFVGNKKNLSGLEGQIKFEGKIHKIFSPATVYIPAGTVHEYKITKGSGNVIVLFKNLDYSHEEAKPNIELGKKEYKKFKELIIKPDIRPTSEIKFHRDSALGKRYVFVDYKKMPQADFYTIVRDAQNIKQTKTGYVDEHAHNCDSYYLFIGNNPDLSGLRAEIVIRKKKKVIESPASVHIPEKIPHYYKPISGSGKFFSIVPKGKYNESLL